MKPFIVTATGIALGLSAVLPLARSQLSSAPAGGAALASAPGIVAAAAAAAAPAAAPTTGVDAQASSPRPVPATARVTVNGPVVATRYGPVQVRIVLAGPRIASVTSLVLPSADRQSRRINSWAGPQLAAEAVAQQSAQVDTVSGASWTSGGYRTSLQGALDLARAKGLAVPA